MKKALSKMLAMMLTAALLLSGCGSTGTGENTQANNEKPASGESSAEKPAEEEKTEEVAQGEAITDLVISKIATSELSTFNLLNSETSADSQYLTNLWDGLLEVNSYGELVPAIAEEWGTEDGGLTWTFHLRDNAAWVDVNGNEKAKCVSQDFLTAMEWILNFHKNDSANTSMPMEMIEGATEYYEYTKSLSAEEAYALNAGEGSKFREMVKIETPDEHTLVYHCSTAKPYFDTVAAYGCLYPLAQGLVDELGVDGIKSMNNENMWYNGCYTMTSYIQGNEKILTKNPLYWDTDCTRFETVTIKMVESSDVAYQLYQSGEIDEVGLTESNIKTISGDESNPYHDKMIEWPNDFRSYQFHFNYDKRKEDGTPDTNWNNAIANEAFRLAWYYGLDLTPSFSRTNAINPLSCENNFYSMPGLLYTSDGTDYTELVRQELGLPQENGETPVRLDADKAAQYKKQAMEELSAIGVTFPVGIDYYISGSNQAALDSANVLAQALSNSLGDDFVQLNIKTYVSSARKEIYEPKLQSINISGWNADYGDPLNYIGQETYGNDSAYYTRTLSNVNDLEENENNKALLDAYKEFSSLVEQADAIHDDLDARYKAFAKAEAYLIQHALTIPNNYNIGWTLTKVNPYSKMKAMYGIQNNKMKNWETNADGYTAEQVAALKEAHESGK